MKEKDPKKRLEQIDAQKKYAGAATDDADNNKVTEHDTKQETSMLNNNPRNSDY